MPGSPSILWFRLDLRLSDNPALAAALKRGAPIIPVFIWAPDEEGPWPPGGASRWWLHQSLRALDEGLRDLGSRLILRSGPSNDELANLIAQTKAEAIFWNRRYEPAIRARDAALKEKLRAQGLVAESFNAALLHEPWTIKNTSGKPFQVFTPFWRHCLSLAEPEPPARAPRRIPLFSDWPTSLRLEDLGLRPRPDWAVGLRAAWRPGEAGAAQALKGFLKGSFDKYNKARDLPGIAGTSRLSPHLHFGEISPRQIWHAIKTAKDRAQSRSPWRSSQYLSELGWREFSHHLLYHFPRTAEKPLRPEFERFRWERNIEWLHAWQKGRTGYPIVDAGMRELWTTGWMHNRVRMVVASFLVKDLRIAWQEGAKWFWDTLVDADLAQNTLGWQWTAGCGADAAPYFRIFNPASQGEKFDADGTYVRKWVPELAHVENKWIHKPQEAPPEVLSKAGIVLGEAYPPPIVSHRIAREVALEEFARIKTSL